MLTITDISGNTEALTGYRGLRRKRNVNGEKTLAFLAIPTDQNTHSYPMVSEESIVEFDGEPYRIKQLSEKSQGTTYYKEVIAVHTFFDLIDEHVYALHTGSMTFENALQFVLSGTEYTWSIVDTFYAQDFDNFGDENRLALFQTLLVRYGAEFTLNGTHITFRERIGNATDFQFRYSYNVKTLARDVNTSNLSTYIKGYGKQNDDGTYVVESEYTSPNASIFGLRHAKPVRDERYTTLEGLNERLAAELNDEPEVSITIDFADLRRAGFPYDVPSEGDDVFLIYEPIGIDVETRLMDIDEEFTEGSDLPIKTVVTLGNIRDSVVDRWANVEKQINDIIGGDGKVKYNALDAAVKRATAALQSAQTELEFENGIIARSKTNPNHLVLLNSAGVGISSDGGQTFREAITADGFVLSAGAIGQLAANNIQIGADTTFDTGYNPIEGELYVRGTGLNRDNTRILRINGQTIYEQIGGRGLRMTVIDRDNLEVKEEYTADTLTNDTQRNELAGKISWYCDMSPNVIIVLTSNDAIDWNQSLIDQVKRIGGATFPTGRTPYAFVGMPGIGEAAGIEVVTSTDSTAAYAEISTSIKHGVPAGIDTTRKALNEKVREDLRLSAPLPTSLTLNQDGIRASTSDPNRYTQLDYRGLYSKGGAVQIERPDGYLSVQDGILKHGFNVQGSVPTFKTTGIEEFGSWYRSRTSNRFENVQRFVFKHDSRYLHIIGGMYSDTVAGGNMAFDVFLESTMVGVANAVVTETRQGPDEYRKEVLLDLGTPTGEILALYWRLYTNLDDFYVYGNIRYLVQEG